jgi:hypothetical protein
MPDTNYSSNRSLFLCCLKRGGGGHMNKDNGQGIESLPPLYLLIYYRGNKLHNKHTFTKYEYKTLRDEMQCVGPYQNALNLLK